MTGETVSRVRRMEYVHHAAVVAESLSHIAQDGFWPTPFRAMRAASR
jgi:hypothetical protein